MPKADGTIVIKTIMDDAKAESAIEKLKTEIQKTEAEIYENDQRKAPLEKKLEDIARKADIAAEKLYAMKNAPAGTYSTPQIKEQEETLRGHQAHWEMINRELKSVNKQSEKLNATLEKQKEKAGGIEKKTNAIRVATSRMAEAHERANKSMDRFGSRLKSVVRSALVFTVVTKALSSLRDWIGEVVKADEEAVAAIANLKGALLTLAQPLVDVIIPAFTKFVNILTYAVTALSRIVSALFGKTQKGSAEAAESLYKETEAMEALGGAAKEATKNLAAFDEINQLTTETASASVGGGVIAPNFDAVSNLPGWLESLVSEIELKIEKLKFAWGKGGLSNAIKNWKKFLPAILGAVIGGSFGGLTGGVIGLILGSLISFAIDDFNAGNIDAAGLLNRFEEVASGMLGAILGNAFGGFHGAMLGLVIGLTFGFAKTLFDPNAAVEDKVVARKQFINSISTLLGAIIGAAFGGVAGAYIGGAIGLTVGLFINFVIEGWNMENIKKYNPNFSGFGPDYSWMFKSSASATNIPALASGSVIPPNREFLAVLGDNKTETEVVSPLSTMKRAFTEALAESGGTSGELNITVITQLDGKEVARNQVKHINNMTREAGKPVLLY